jgi:hypothetical protein
MISSLAILLAFAVVPGAAQDLPRAAAGKAQSEQRLIQDRQDRLQYAIDDEKAAKAAAEEAKSRALRDQQAYDAKTLTAAELSASLAVKERFFYDYLAKGTATKLARHGLQQALLVNVHPRSVQDLRLIELFKVLAVVQEKQHELEYALNDEKAAKAAAHEAQARAARDQAAYDAKALSAAELGASLAAKEKFYFEHLKKGTEVRVARTHLERAKQSLNPKIP